MSEAIHSSTETQQAHSEQVQTSCQTLSSQAAGFGQTSSTSVGETTSTLDSLIAEVRLHVIISRPVHVHVHVYGIKVLLILPPPAQEIDWGEGKGGY